MITLATVGLLNSVHDLGCKENGRILLWMRPLNIRSS